MTFDTEAIGRLLAAHVARLEDRDPADYAVRLEVGRLAAIHATVDKVDDKPKE